MKKRIIKLFLALFALVIFTNLSTAQVNMNRWIELTVQPGELISLAQVSHPKLRFSCCTTTWGFLRRTLCPTNFSFLERMMFKTECVVNLNSLLTRTTTLT